ncbi:MAG: hypothetical protein ACOH2F_08440 [Cellulomonas sp.]
MGDLAAILTELMAREPALDHRELVHSAETFDAETADDFWEVGASGRVYSRDYLRSVALQRLQDTGVDARITAGWTTEDHNIRRLGPDTYLVTYQLNGQGRRTRRATIWRSSPAKGWHVLYHQGTVINEPAT